MKRLLLLFSLLIPVFAQDNYEIQVYPSETMAPGRTMFELHSNLTIEGTKQVIDGVLPTEHAWHETAEITRGFSDWYETGVYFFTSANPGYGWQFVGTHIRPRVRVPEEWKWPVGVSLSAEFGYVRPNFSADTWTLELRPIIDKQLGRWYLDFNPTIDKSFVGISSNHGFEFSPNFKAAYSFNKKIAGGLEYYGALGPIGNFDPIHDQEQQILPAIDLDLSPDWEFNLGVGVGVTQGTDHLLVKMILGYRFKH